MNATPGVAGTGSSSEAAALRASNSPGGPAEPQVLALWPGQGQGSQADEDEDEGKDESLEFKKETG